jgi:hypothetical protein
MEIEISIVNTFVLICASVFGWLIRTLWGATRELKDDLTKLKEEMPIKFVLKDDYKTDIREIKDMLKSIFDRLDHKADKE